MQPRQASAAPALLRVHECALLCPLQVICVTAGYYASLTRAKADGDHTGDVLFQPLGGFEAGAAALLVSCENWRSSPRLVPPILIWLLGG